MRGPLRLRPLTEEEERVITKLVRSRTASVRLVHRLGAPGAPSQDYPSRQPGIYDPSDYAAASDDRTHRAQVVEAL